LLHQLRWEGKGTGNPEEDKNQELAMENSIKWKVLFKLLRKFCKVGEV